MYDAPGTEYSSSTRSVSSTGLQQVSVKPRVVFVGGPDVDNRLELIHCLTDTYNVSAVGTLPSLCSRFRAHGIGYVTYRLSRKANALLDLLTLAQLALLFLKTKPQIVHTFDTKPSVWARLAARAAGVPIIIGTLPGLGSLYSGDGVKTRIIRFVYERLQALACHVSDLTIFQNQDDATEFIRRRVVSEKKAMVIPGSGVSTARFTRDDISAAERTQLRRELRVRTDHIVVTMISRVIRSKGILEFAAAAESICTANTRIRFLLVGSQDHESLDRLNSAELAEVKQAVTFLGPRADIRNVLAISDVFVLPSAYREGIPRVLLEAASMGLPIVTTNAPGCREVVEDGVNGVLVPVGDCEALTHAIVSLLEQPRLRQRFGYASRRRAVERFDLSVVAGRTHLLYGRLLRDKGLV